jgi:hypothetical protein
MLARAVEEMAAGMIGAMFTEEGKSVESMLNEAGGAMTSRAGGVITSRTGGTVVPRAGGAMTSRAGW